MPSGFSKILKEKINSGEIYVKINKKGDFNIHKTNKLDIYMKDKKEKEKE